MTRVLDASAALAFLQDEHGAEVVERTLLAGAVIGAANWSEVAQKVRARGGDWSLSRSLLNSYGLTVEPVTSADAEQAAAAWHTGTPLSLADRLCIALSIRLGVPAVTADREWGDDGVEQIR